MEVASQLLMAVLLLLSLSFAVAVAADVKYAIPSPINCKFSNEGCENDWECCSGKCVQAHPGTNPRCTRSSLHRSCLYSYQCEDRLMCGRMNTCCSKFWGTCSKHDDCCKPKFDNMQPYVCIEADGFYYKRCLIGQARTLNSGSQGGPTTLRAASMLGTILLVLFGRMLVHFCVTVGNFL